jgi:hypothetical protein
VQHVGTIVGVVAYVAALFDDPTHRRLHHLQGGIAMVQLVVGGAPEPYVVAVDLVAEFVCGEAVAGGT